LNPNLGNALEVELPSTWGKLKEGDQFKLRVHYHTNEQTTALSWLTPEQTAGGKLPYLFTQCETILQISGTNAGHAGQQSDLRGQGNSRLQISGVHERQCDWASYSSPWR